MDTSARLRGAMVQKLAEAEDLWSSPVREAFLSVPRELFVAEIAREHGLEYVYRNQALVTRQRHGVPTSSSSQPSVMALMLEALTLEPGHQVLEIGLGTGYNAALLSRLVGAGGRVTSVDIEPDIVSAGAKVLRDNGFTAEAVAGDGREGWAPGAPYDRIIATASTEAIPRAWWEQLAPGGLLVVPMRKDAMQIIVAFERTGFGFRSRHLIPGGFMPLRDAGPGDGLPVGESMSLIVLRWSLPSGNFSASAAGPAVVHLSRSARQGLVGNLAVEPIRTPIPALPSFDTESGVAVQWFIALAGERERQIGLFLESPDEPIAIRFGLADAASGAFSTFVVQRVGVRPELVGIDTFGEGSACLEELLGLLQRWIDSGSPALDRLSIEVHYHGAGFEARQSPGSVEHPDHSIYFDWV